MYILFKASYNNNFPFTELKIYKMLIKTSYISFKIMINPANKAEILMAFKQYDKDDSGYLDKSEIKLAIKEMNSHLESLGLSLTDKDVEEMTARADTNKDGKIELKEFFSLI